MKIRHIKLASYDKKKNKNKKNSVGQFNHNYTHKLLVLFFIDRISEKLINID